MNARKTLFVALTAVALVTFAGCKKCCKKTQQETKENTLGTLGSRSVESESIESRKENLEI